MSVNIMTCIQDTLSPSASREQRYLAYNIMTTFAAVCKMPLLARKLSCQAKRATMGYLVYKISWNFELDPKKSLIIRNLASVC